MLRSTEKLVMFCSNCGAQVGNDCYFCSICGQKKKYSRLPNNRPPPDS